MDHDLSTDELMQQIEHIRAKLLRARNERVRPHKDDKVLTDWNGLMIAALARAGRLLDDDGYRKRAQKAADFVLAHMRKADGRLWHRFRKGQAGIEGQLDDYAFFIFGLLELYQATFQPSYLQAAVELQGQQDDHFWDGERHGYYLTPHDGESLLVRQKEVYDGAIPAGNSLALLNLLQLGRISADSRYDQRAAQLSEAFAHNVSRAPLGHTFFLLGHDYAMGPAYELVIAGQSAAPDTHKLRRAAERVFLPNKVLLFSPTGTGAADSTALLAHLKDYSPIEGRATAYVCRNYSCKLPVHGDGELIRLLREEAQSEALH